MRLSPFQRAFRLELVSSNFSAWSQPRQMLNWMCPADFNSSSAGVCGGAIGSRASSFEPSPDVPLLDLHREGSDQPADSISKRAPAHQAKRRLGSPPCCHSHRRLGATDAERRRIEFAPIVSENIGRMYRPIQEFRHSCMA
jgi:hypothetical protein